MDALKLVGAVLKEMSLGLYFLGAAILLICVSPFRWIIYLLQPKRGEKL